LLTRVGDVRNNLYSADTFFSQEKYHWVLAYICVTDHPSPSQVAHFTPGKHFAHPRKPALWNGKVPAQLRLGDGLAAFSLSGQAPGKTSALCDHL
jgi:hypothetical protein